MIGYILSKNTESAQTNSSFTQEHHLMPLLKISKSPFLKYLRKQRILHQIYSLSRTEEPFGLVIDCIIHESAKCLFITKANRKLNHMDQNNSHSPKDESGPAQENL